MSAVDWRPKWSGDSLRSERCGDGQRAPSGAGTASVPRAERSRDGQRAPERSRDNQRAPSGAGTASVTLSGAGTASRLESRVE
eukprot:g37978.t1